MVKIVKVFTAVNTEDEFILAAEFSDGTTRKDFEWRRIDDSHVEVINHCIDKNGNFYKTRNVYEYKGVSPEFLRSRCTFSEFEHADNLCAALEDGIKEISKSTYPFYARNLLRTARHWRESDSFNYNPMAAAKMDKLIIELENMQ